LKPFSSFTVTPGAWTCAILRYKYFSAEPFQTPTVFLGLLWTSWDLLFPKAVGCFVH
jgi:hypothetical protein